MSSPLVAPPVVRTKPLACPNCGGPIDFRTFGSSVTVICPQCLSVLDSSNPQLEILQKVNQEQNRRTPVIPLGTRGALKGATWEVIGFQTRCVNDDGELFEWEEYLLFNPYKGFRYLTNYRGHWNFVVPLEPMPQRTAHTARPIAWFEGHTYKHFTGGMAATSFVLGEFPWRVKVGETVLADDFVDPPRLLSSETTNDEVTWSQGEYVPGAEIWKAFNLPGAPPKPEGIYLNQPSPYTGKVWGIWKMFFLMELLLFVVMVAFSMVSKKDVALEETRQFSPLDKGEPSYVTAPFEFKGHAAPVQLAITTDLSNNSAYFGFALINEDTGQAYDFNKEISYYFGSDSDGAWTEGQSSATITIPAVPAGHYYLRVEPEMDTATESTNPFTPKGMRYHLTLTHDAPSYIWFVFAGALLLIPPIWYSIQAKSFEARRWMDSDHAPGGGSNSESSSDD
jgi:hypothetical protein